MRGFCCSLRDGHRPKDLRGEGGLRLHWPTLATAARNRVHKAARNVFRPAHSSAESRLSARRSGAGQSGSAVQVAAVTPRVRRTTPRPPAVARCAIPRGLLSSRFLNSAARSQAPAAGRRSMLSGSQITSSTPLVQYVIHEATVTKRGFILEPFLHGRYPASLRRLLFLHHHLSPGPEASTWR